VAPADVERVKSKVADDALRSTVDRWYGRAQEEIERDRLRQPPKLE
jgi:hypothetical protein